MELIPEFYKDIMTYNRDGNFYERMPEKPMKNKNKFFELVSIIEAFTNEKINHSNWKYPENCYQYYQSDQNCICSENDCRHLFFKTHERTGFTFKFGSECILKFHDVKDNGDEKERNYEKEFQKKTIQNFKKDTCKYKKCEEKVLDKRKKHCKLGYCSIECEENDIPFCLCGIKAKSGISKKKNQNFGKQYFSCGNSRYQYNGQWKNGCGFFKWNNDFLKAEKKKNEDMLDLLDFELAEEDLEAIYRIESNFYERKALD